jgi:hypothetical protein
VSGPPLGRREIPLRRAEVRFARPYAVVAVGGYAPDPDSGTAHPWFGTPVFGAWVADPAQAD